MGSLLMPAAARSFCTCEGLDRNRFTRKSRSGTRLQALASEGASDFNKANYFADRTLSKRLITPQQVLDSGGAKSRANPGRSGLLDGAPSANVEVDPRRAAMTFVSAQKQPIAYEAGAMDRAVSQTTIQQTFYNF